MDVCVCVSPLPPSPLPFFSSSAVYRPYPNFSAFFCFFCCVFDICKRPREREGGGGRESHRGKEHEGIRGRREHVGMRGRRKRKEKRGWRRKGEREGGGGRGSHKGTEREGTSM